MATYWRVCKEFRHAKLGMYGGLVLGLCHFFLKNDQAAAKVVKSNSKITF